MELDYFQGLKGLNYFPFRVARPMSRPYRAERFDVECLPGASPQAVTSRAFSPEAIGVWAQASRGKLCS